MRNRKQITSFKAGIIMLCMKSIHSQTVKKNEKKKAFMEQIDCTVSLFFMFKSDKLK